MAASDDFVSFLCDTLAPLGVVRFRRMFGGGGLFCDGLMFAIISDDTLFLKADRETVPDFEAEGLSAFVYAPASGRRAVMSYWRAPERLLDDTDEMLEWARRAIGAARRQQVRPKPRVAAKGSGRGAGTRSRG